MKIAVIVIAALLVPILSPSQPSNVGTERAVRELFLGLSKGEYNSFGERAVERLGDQGPAALMRVFEGRDLSAEDVDHALIIVRFSFEAPGAITMPSNRIPRATLFLLKDLSYRTHDKLLSQKIVSTRAFVEKAAQWHPPKNKGEG